MSFEQALKKLEDMSNKIRSQETSLDDALFCYEEGIKAYNECLKVLKETEQKIEVFEK